MPSNVEVARIFLRIAGLMSYRDESAFKVRAYYRAALTLSALTTPLSEVEARGEVRTLPGVGDAIAGKIGEILQTGDCALYARLRAETPPQIQALLKVPGLTPRLVRLLETEFRVQSVDDLKTLTRSGDLAELEGLTIKVEDAAFILIAVEALGALEPEGE